MVARDGQVAIGVSHGHVSGISEPLTLCTRTHWTGPQPQQALDGCLGLFGTEVRVTPHCEGIAIGIHSTVSRTGSRQYRTASGKRK